MATLVADDVNATRLICLGYPFHPTGKPDRLRLEPLTSLQTPTLIVQGERDPMGNRDEVMGYQLPPSFTVKWMPDGDHSFKPRKASGRTAEQNWQAAAESVVDFLQ